MFTAPPLRRRIVGGTLRRYRENLGYTLDDAARILECDRSKISRIETGQRGIRGKELRELLAEYGIDDQQQAILGAMADPQGARGGMGGAPMFCPGRGRTISFSRPPPRGFWPMRPSGYPRCSRLRTTHGR